MSSQLYDQILMDLKLQTSELYDPMTDFLHFREQGMSFTNDQDQNLLLWYLEHAAPASTHLVLALCAQPEIDINHADVNGNTALHYAGIKRDTPLAVFKALLENKADPNLRNCFSQGVINKVALDQMRVDPQVATLLVTHGF